MPLQTCAWLALPHYSPSAPQLTLLATPSSSSGNDSNNPCGSSREKRQGVLTATTEAQRATQSLCLSPILRMPGASTDLWWVSTDTVGSKQFTIYNSDTKQTLQRLGHRPTFHIFVTFTHLHIPPERTLHLPVQQAELASQWRFALMGVYFLF